MGAIWVCSVSAHAASHGSYGSHNSHDVAALYLSANALGGEATPPNLLSGAEVKKTS